MKCGDRGHVGANGSPCGQTISASAKACLWHSRDAEERRALAMRGAAASRLRSVPTLAADTPSPVLDSPAGVRRLIGDTIQAARTGALDYRIASVVIAGATAAIKLAELEVAAQLGALEKRFHLRRA
jgi:hypothetical protein